MAHLARVWKGYEVSKDWIEKYPEMASHTVFRIGRNKDLCPVAFFIRH